jgi:hypothetical protein
MKYLLVSCGCAECGLGGEPLIETQGPFDTEEEAKAAAWSQQQAITRDLPMHWQAHPQGGWFWSTGQGDDWVLPVPDDFPAVPTLPEEG